MNNYNNYLRLSVAIIRSACADYIKCRRLQEENPNDREAELMVKKLKKFFYGKNFAALSLDSDPDYFIKKLEANV